MSKINHKDSVFGQESQFSITCSGCSQNVTVGIKSIVLSQSCVSAVKYADNENGRKLRDAAEERWREGSFKYNCPHCRILKTLDASTLDKQDKEYIREHGEHIFRISE